MRNDNNMPRKDTIITANQFLKVTGVRVIIKYGHQSIPEPFYHQMAAVNSGNACL